MDECLYRFGDTRIREYEIFPAVEMIQEKNFDERGKYENPIVISINKEYWHIIGW